MCVDGLILPAGQGTTWHYSPGEPQHPGGGGTTQTSESQKNPELKIKPIMKMSCLTVCCVFSCRTASSSTTPTIKARWSRPARRRQTGGWWRETTWSTGYQHPHPRRRRSGSSPSSRSFCLLILVEYLVECFFESTLETEVYQITTVNIKSTLQPTPGVPKISPGGPMSSLV